MFIDILKCWAKQALNKLKGNEEKKHTHVLNKMGCPNYV